MENVLVIGGGYAGILAALRLAGKTKKTDLKVTLVNAADTFTERIRLHQLATKQSLKVLSIPHLLRGKNIDFVQGWVSAIDLETKTVRLSDGRSLGYDRLVYALGSHTDVNTVPGVRDNAYTLDASGLHHAAAFAETLLELNKSHGRVVVCGGGLTGIESVVEIAETYPDLQVTMVTKGAVGSHLSEKGRAYLRKVFDALGIQVVNGTITGIQANHVQLSDGSLVPFDACLWAGSFTVSPLARETGLQVNARGQILIDRTMRSLSHPEVYAIGDSAAFVDPAVVPIRMACATAMPMGAHAADAILAHRSGKQADPFSFAYALQCISLGRHNALVQWVHADDSPKESIVTGWMASLVKEIICRFTTFSLGVERRFPGSYLWLHHEVEAQEVEIKDAAESYGTV